MNQILVTRKLYLTPELKRKQSIYRFCFFLSIFVIGILSSVYAYGIYEQNLNEELSQEILNSVTLGNANSSQFSNDNILVVYLDDDVSDEDLIELDSNTPLLSTYTASNGKEYDIVGIINIPIIEVNYPILSTTDDELLKVSVCRYTEEVEPNTVGNLCIAGHNFTNTRAFSQLNKLKDGDIIEITDLSGKTLKYEVFDTYIISPTDLRCTNQDTNGQKEITLITCTNGVKQRRIVKAREIIENHENSNLQGQITNKQ